MQVSAALTLARCSRVPRHPAGASATWGLRETFEFRESFPDLFDKFLKEFVRTPWRNEHTPVAFERGRDLVLESERRSH
jgi:hypothetical protein